MNKLQIVVVAALACVMSSCLKSPEPFDAYAQLAKDKTTIKNYLTDNNLTAIEDPNGVYIVVNQLGTGLPAQNTSTVDVDYVGKLFSDQSVIFDQGNVKGVLSSYISGWQIAMNTLPEGSKATLYIPSGWGYGNVAQGKIPASSILVFDITFKDAKRSSVQLTKFKADTTAIENYLTTKSIVNAVTDTTGVRYVITQEGSGPVATWYNKLKFKYTIKSLADDTKVLGDFTREPSTTFYNRVVDQIQGLKIGLTKMTAGSKATFYLPSEYGLGPAGVSTTDFTVPGNTNLIIDVELTEIQ
jgi:FKBP-type peptidyl-prolyl cis-trans isomerase